MRLQPMPESAFITELLTEQPFIPEYFGYDVELNRTGAPSLQDSLFQIPVVAWKNNAHVDPESHLDPALWIIDTRDQAKFVAGHWAHSINIMQNGRFETWLGSMIRPHEKFYL